MDRPWVRYGVIALVGILVIFLLVQCSKRLQRAPATAPEQGILAGDGVPTLTFPENTPVAPPKIVEVPAPKTSVSYGNAAYSGEKIGQLQIDGGLVFEVYSPVIDSTGNILLPDNGLVLWEGNFIGHLIQNAGWISINESSQLKWISLTGSKTNFVVVAIQKDIGFVTPLSALPQGYFKFVTCYVDLEKSTSNNRVFGGNKIFTLNIK